MRNADGIEGIQILSSLWRESVIESQCDIAVERINIIEISQSVYGVLLGHHLFKWYFLILETHLTISNGTLGPEAAAHPTALS